MGTINKGKGPGEKQGKGPGEKQGKGPGEKQGKGPGEKGKGVEADQLPENRIE